MPKNQATILKVVIASPSDVKKERDLVEKVVNELNRGTARDRNLRLETYRWETDAYAGFHAEGPQGIIDDILGIEEAWVLIGIFWSTLGAPGTDGKTGTEHEVDLAIEAWKSDNQPQPMIYFRTAPPILRTPAERRQWAQVAQYQEKIASQKGLSWEYRTPIDFERILRTNLQNYLRQSHPTSSGRASGRAEGAKRGNEETPSRAGLAAQPGYSSDSVSFSDEPLEDELEVRRQVQTLCAVVLAKSIEPPLAIGLFGDWGTGKTYFMEYMRREIDQVCDLVANSDDETAFHSEVAQIQFNAWNYIDANLWASLVSHIFDELARRIAPDEPEKAKSWLIQRLEIAKEGSASIRHELQLLQRKKQEQAADLRALEEDRRQSIDQLRDLKLSDVTSVLFQDPGVAERLSELKKALGISRFTWSATEAEALLQRIRGLGIRARTFWSQVWGQPGAWRRISLILAILISAPILAWLLDRMLQDQHVISRVAGVVTELAAAIAVLTKTLEPHWHTASNTLKKLESTYAEIQSRVDAMKRKQSAAETELEAQVKELEGREAAARVRLSNAESKVEEIERELARLELADSLPHFIVERARSEDYRQHLGVISTIRKDFERLSTLLAQGNATQGFRPIRRIVLYIDDLDRCPATKVVEVLQAVHLLLAFRLFVVVVGVDSRWLLNALEREYSAFQQSPTDGARSAMWDESWVTTPQNYLEKIFQIPYVLDRMSRTGYERLIGRLLPSATSEVTGRTRNRRFSNREASRSQAPARERSGLESTASDPTRRLTEKPRDLNPKSLLIRPWEQDFACFLFPFIPTPRSAKRFTNIYRLLKAPLEGEQLDRFEGTSDEPGEFQAPMVLLAVLIGFPKEAKRLCGLLLTQGTGSWRVVVEDFRSNESQDDRLSELLEALLAEVKLRDSIEPFVAWIPRVARFSFEVGRVVGSEHHQ